MGINWLGIVMGLGFCVSFGYWTTDFLVVQRVLAAKDLRSARLAPIIGAGFKMFVPFIVIVPGLLGLAVLPMKLYRRRASSGSQLQRSAASDVGALPAAPGSWGSELRR